MVQQAFGMTPRAETAAPTQVELSRRAAGGDREALSALLREHAPAIFKLCHLVSGANDGRDAAQDALERIVTGIRQFDPDRGTFRSWALTVARNVCRDRLRRRGLESAAFLGDGEAQVDLARAATVDPEHAVMVKAGAARLDAALAALPEGHRSALVLFHLHEASYEEIASSLDVPVGTVMTWLHRGRKRLRAALEQEEQRA
jgi:RNA polymerase sigma-70 factor (ECF subfamily)